MRQSSRPRGANPSDGVRIHAPCQVSDPEPECGIAVQQIFYVCLWLERADSLQGPQLVSREQGRQWFQTRASRMRAGTKPDLEPL